MPDTNSTVLERWHKYVSQVDINILDELLADDVVFHSPVVWTPQQGKQITKMYLSAAVKVLGNKNFIYSKEIIGAQQIMLEFTTIVDDVTINGVDIITYDSNDKITEFKVMVRPLQGLQKLHQKMMEMLTILKK